MYTSRLTAASTPRRGEDDAKPHGRRPRKPVGRLSLQRQRSGRSAPNTTATDAAGTVDCEAPSAGVGNNELPRTASSGISAAAISLGTRARTPKAKVQLQVVFSTSQILVLADVVFVV